MEVQAAFTFMDRLHSVTCWLIECIRPKPSFWSAVHSLISCHKSINVDPGHLLHGQNYFWLQSLFCPQLEKCIQPFPHKMKSTTVIFSCTTWIIHFANSFVVFLDKRWFCVKWMHFVTEHILFSKKGMCYTWFPIYFQNSWSTEQGTLAIAWGWVENDWIMLCFFMNNPSQKCVYIEFLAWKILH